jgi:hypothetical protein
LNALASGLDTGTVGSAGVVGTDGSAGAVVETTPFESAEFKLGSFGIAGFATEAGFGVDITLA